MPETFCSPVRRGAMRLLFSFAGGEGHLQPLVPLARAAVVQGHEVAVTGAPAIGRVVDAAGLAFLPTPPDVKPQRVPLQPVDIDRERAVVRDAYAGRIAGVRTAELLRLCADWRPDVVVRDETDYGAAIAAERAGVPHASVLVIAAGGFAPPELVAEPLNRLRAAHGLPADAAAMLSRNLVLSPFAPSFRDPADPLPPTARSFRSTEAALPPHERAGGRPLVYVTLGTIFNAESGDLLQRVVSGVRVLPVDVVVTVGWTMDPDELGPQPANVHVERYIPQSQLLPRCAAVVSHAGSGSVAGALEHGVPLVCIPLGADQPLNAARCTALGVGLALDAMALTPDDARAAVSEVLSEPRYRSAAVLLQAEIAAQPPPSHAVALLERLSDRRRV
jgi:UDP:flavonoid glycosyltransferase YjiC (YdhE family)